MSKHLSLVFHIDPAHGWLEVERSHIADLGICNRVSRCSYVGDTIAFLEEDCDMPLFLDTAKQFGWTVSYEESHYDHLATIRNLPRYAPPPYTCAVMPKTSPR